MVGTKLPLLICFSISSLFAEIVTVNVSGVTTGGDYTVVQNSYSGAYGAFPADYYSTGATTTLFGAGTIWTAQFTFDTALLPASIQSNISGLNGADPITTYLLDSSTIQFAKATFTIGSFSFTTGAHALDVPPTAIPPNQFTAVNTPLSYGSRIAYGDTIYNAQGFNGYSSVQSAYSFLDQTVGPDNPSSINYGRFGSMSFHIYQDNAVGPLFTAPGVPTNFSYTDTGLPFPASNFGFGFAAYSFFTDQFKTINGELNVDASYITFSGADLEVRSAVTAGYTPADQSPVPEPSTLAMGGIGLALIAWGRSRRSAN